MSREKLLAEINADPRKLGELVRENLALKERVGRLVVRESLLIEKVHEMGAHYDECTRLATGIICPTCNCGKSDKAAELLGGGE